MVASYQLDAPATLIAGERAPSTQWIERSCADCTVWAWRKENYFRNRVPVHEFVVAWLNCSKRLVMWGMLTYILIWRHVCQRAQHCVGWFNLYQRMHLYIWIQYEYNIQYTVWIQYEYNITYAVTLVTLFAPACFDHTWSSSGSRACPC